MREVKESRGGRDRSRRKDLKALELAFSLSLSMLWMISGWNEAGRWLDLSVHRFKFRPDQTRRLGPRPRSKLATSGSSR